MIRPGEIYVADFEEMEPHPVVVVSREELNRGNWVAAVLIASSGSRSDRSNHTASLSEPGNSG